MFKTAFRTVARQSALYRSYSTARSARTNNKVVIGASLIASSLILLPLSVVENEVEPSTENAKLTRIEGGVSAEDHITFGKRNQPRKATDAKQPETKIIPVDEQTKKSEQSKPPQGSIKNPASTEDSKPSDGKASEPKKALKEDKTEQKGTESKLTKESTEAKEGAEEEVDGEENGGQSAAFNPETGEINWDCPCLGGMAHGPCGEEFKAAFSCFVYSETEPKGIDCIEKFEGMRNCFRQHPEHYKEELYEDDEPVPSTDANDDSTSSNGVDGAVSNKEATVDIPKVA